MKQRLLLRAKDRIRPENNPLLSSKTNPLLGFVDWFPEISSKTRHLNQREYQGVLYRYEEDTTVITLSDGRKPSEYSCWDLYLEGITLPKYNRIITNNLVRVAFETIMRQEGLHHRFTYNRKNNSPSVLELEDAIQCDHGAHQIIDAYLKRQDELNSTLKKIDRVYPITREECSEVLSILKGK